ncbi:MAG: hypothetical protein HC822_08370 [Oscillochloris sp.]|nr:hypothetical protein [Oscillochloris sp.]
MTLPIGIIIFVIVGLGMLRAIVMPPDPPKQAQVIYVQAVPPQNQSSEQGSGFGLVFLLIAICILAAYIFPAS